MFSHTQDILNKARRTRERTEQLCRELRATFAESLVVLLHSRRQRDATPPSRTDDLADRAEQSKRNRETVVRNPKAR